MNNTIQLLLLIIPLLSIPVILYLYQKGKLTKFYKDFALLGVLLSVIGYFSPRILSLILVYLGACVFLGTFPIFIVYIAVRIKDFLERRILKM